MNKWRFALNQVPLPKYCLQTYETGVLILMVNMDLALIMSMSILQVFVCLLCMTRR